MQGINDLKRLLYGSLPKEKISKVTESFKEAMGISEVDVLLLCDKPQDVAPHLSKESCLPVVLSEKDAKSSLLDQHDVWLVILLEVCPPRFIAWMAEQTGKTIIMSYKESLDMDIPIEVQKKAFITRSMGEAITIASFLSLYNTFRKDLIKPFYLFGLAPTAQAPSYSAQTGWINELIFSEDRQ